MDKSCDETATATLSPTRIRGDLEQTARPTNTFTEVPEYIIVITSDSVVIR